MSTDDGHEEGVTIVETAEDLQGRLSQVLKLFTDKVAAFESMRTMNLDLVRRLSEAVALQMRLHGRIVRLETEVRRLTELNAKLSVCVNSQSKEH